MYGGNGLQNKIWIRNSGLQFTDFITTVVYYSKIQKKTHPDIASKDTIDESFNVYSQSSNYQKSQSHNDIL